MKKTILTVIVFFSIFFIGYVIEYITYTYRGIPIDNPYSKYVTAVILTTFLFFRHINKK